MWSKTAKWYEKTFPDISLRKPNTSWEKKEKDICYFTLSEKSGVELASGFKVHVWPASRLSAVCPPPRLAPLQAPRHSRVATAGRGLMQKPWIGPRWAPCPSPWLDHGEKPSHLWEDEKWELPKENEGLSREIQQMLVEGSPTPTRPLQR